MKVTKPTYSDREELGSNLRSLFLCFQSAMRAAVDSLVKTRRFNLTLEVSGQGNPGYDLFVRVANQLGVQFKELELSKTLRENPFWWLTDRSTKNLRAWIPEMKDREGDLHVMLPICFEHHVTELRKHDPAFRMPKVDSLYLLVIWSDCFRVNQAPLSARVFRDIVAFGDVGIIIALRFADFVGNQIRKANSMAMSLSQNAQMYLGFSAGRGSYEQCEKSGLLWSSFNDRTFEILDALGYDDGIETAVPPWMIRNYSWKADQVGVILKNAWAQHSWPSLGTEEDIRKSRECLELRLDGLTEDEIAKRLQFDDRKEYDKWLKQRELDTDPQAFQHPYEGWLAACEYFGVEPTPELFESLVQTCEDSGQSLETGASPEPETRAIVGPDKDDPIPGFRYSLDFRSLHLPTGRLLTLTERQAQVIETLFLSLANDTPELSQAFIIEEVYPGVSEKRLKRLFDDNELYELLIESGSKRGLVKLRTHFE